MKINTKILFVIFFAINTIISAQTDTLTTYNNNILVGEIKKLENGVLTMKTGYSDSDFKIEWLKVKKLKSENSFRFILSDGNRFFGTIMVDTIDQSAIIFDDEKGIQHVKLKNIVFIEKVDRGSIFDVLKLSMDFGYSFTKTSELHQLNGDINASYSKKKWGINAYYNTVQNVQKDVDPTKRNSGGFGYRYFIKFGMFGTADAEYYSNNEQQMDLRSNYAIGVGKYIVRTNKIYFSGIAGVSYTFENYSDTIEDRKSIEGKFGIEYNMFDVGDINLFTKVMFYPSFTEAGRIRTNININIKYDLPRDFYIRSGLDYKYDNQQIEGSDADDYVFTVGVGWKL